MTFILLLPSGGPESGYFIFNNIMAYISPDNVYNPSQVPQTGEHTIMKIGIIGLGLIGGSMAKAIRERTSHTVYGYDINDETMFLAKMTRGIDAALDDSSIGECDVILIAVRPDYAVQWVKDNASKIGKNSIVIDLCGVKRCVTDAIRPVAKENGFRYIGGHPMAGKETAGYNNAASHLFDGASMILTPDENSDLPMLETLRDLFYSIGFAKLTFSTPDEHDRIIAYTSQLAHVTSSAYIKSPESQEQFGFSAGSFRDMTRVARLDEDMWTVLMMDNADYLSAQVDILIDNLREYQTALHEKDAEKLRELLKKGREMKESANGR